MLKTVEDVVAGKASPTKVILKMKELNLDTTDVFLNYNFQFHSMC